MKTVAITTLLALMGLPIMAQTNSCALQPSEVKNIASEIAVSLQNTTGKQVASYTFGLTFYDVNGHAHSFPHQFTDSVKLASHERRTAVWSLPQAHQFLFPLAQAFLLEASFTDGTDWVDDGSRSCSITSVQE